MSDDVTKGREIERAAIAAWMRAQCAAKGWVNPKSSYLWFADCVEKGAHLEGGKP